MKELVVISGKGGTGKTSLVASLASLAKDKVLADCDVDAADLHLILAPVVQTCEDFTGGRRPEVQVKDCSGCGLCQSICRFDAIHMRVSGAELTVADVDPVACEGCEVCAHLCPTHAIDLIDAVNGQLMVSETRHGPMVHAALGIAEENSGKLVAQVRARARQLADGQGLPLMIVDGPPGIGCPVIASITGADMVLIVTEPTPSGLHDLERVLDLASHFGIPAVVVINKYDLNLDVSEAIADRVHQRGSELIGQIRYDRSATRAQVVGQSLVEFTSEGAAADMLALWSRLEQLLMTE